MRATALCDVFNFFASSVWVMPRRSRDSRISTPIAANSPMVFFCVDILVHMEYIIYDIFHMNKKAVDISHLSTFGLLSSTDTVIRVDSKILLQKTIQTLQIKGTAFVIVGGGSNSLFAPVVDKVLVVIEIPGIAYVDNEVTAGAECYGMNW